MTFKQILDYQTFDQQMISRMLNCNITEHEQLMAKARQIQSKYIGLNVYGRALIELSNICKKDCYYCGIRSSNTNVKRYLLNSKDAKSAIDLAIESNIASIAIQSGEQTSEAFIDCISDLVAYAKSQNSNIGITLSCGEQSKEVYQKWFDLGAERYLLRIESSDEQLYYQVHPKNERHNFNTRLKCLNHIKEIGYQTGTGVMIGLPNQNIEHLAKDILFMRDWDIDMCGMGPFIACKGTPMENSTSSFSDSFIMSLRMIAVIRIVMKDINIVASTAMETLKENGRGMAISAGANVIMPNVSPDTFRSEYALYNNKPNLKISSADQIIQSCEKDIPEDYKFVIGKKGNSPHYNSSIYNLK
jgi:biotin synthase